jgi:hypothetical protein
MAAHENLSGKQFFHGTTFRFGHIKAGDHIVPGIEIDAGSHHDPSVFPEAQYWAHATPNLESARHYAEWAADGSHENTNENETFEPHVFQVRPVGEAMTDPRNREGIRARRLRVVRRVTPNE